MIEIRNVKIENTEEILKIYEYYILNTAITFEISVSLRINAIKNRI